MCRQRERGTENGIIGKAGRRAEREREETRRGCVGRNRHGGGGGKGVGNDKGRRANATHVKAKDHKRTKRRKSARHGRQVGCPAPTKRGNMGQSRVDTQACLHRSPHIQKCPQRPSTPQTREGPHPHLCLPSDLVARQPTARLPPNSLQTRAFSKSPRPFSVSSVRVAWQRAVARRWRWATTRRILIWSAIHPSPSIPPLRRVHIYTYATVKSGAMPRAQKRPHFRARCAGPTS